MNKSVPEGWVIHPLNDKVEILSGYPFKSSLFCDDSSRMGIIRIRDLMKQNVETFYAGDFDEEFVVRQGDILIGMDGDFNIVKWKTKNALLNQRICKVKASKSGGFNTDFLFYSLVDDLDSIHAATGATTVKHLSVKDIKGIEKAYPPPPEQKKIAAILSSVDTVIEKTRAQIDKLKDLKTGMMQELLTKGIGPGGVPHTEFKESPVGEIPVNWVLQPLLRLASEERHSFVNGPFGSDLLSSELTDSGVPVIYVRDLKDSKYERVSTVCVTKEKADSLPACNVAKGDILVAKVGDPPCNSGVYEFESRAIVTQDVIRIRPSEKIDPHFFAYLLNSPLGRKQIEKIEIAGTRKRVSLTEFKSLLLPMPPREEQERIGKVLRSVDHRIHSTERNHAAYVRVKKALMQDLLTGKVRVNVEKQERESAVA